MCPVASHRPGAGDPDGLRRFVVGHNTCAGADDGASVADGAATATTPASTQSGTAASPNATP